MLDDGGRTEKPTPKRRRKARSEGQVARSAEVNSAVVLGATLAVLALMAPRLLHAGMAVMARGLSQAASPELVGDAGIRTLEAWGMKAFVGAAAPIVLAAAAAGILASVGQVGLRFSAKALRPSFAKLNVVKGLQRMFSPSQSVELAKNLAKTAAVGGVAYSAFRSRLPTIGALVGAPPGQLVAELGHAILSIGLRVAAALAVIAVLDFTWQRRRHEKRLKMTKQEVKTEHRESDVAPELKGQIRRRQNEMARKRMLADVPGADVVVVNPTHYAVALRYDGTKPAPEVVAKGVDHVALAIRRAAEEAGVTVVHEPPLARALYRDVELGQMIPEELYAAVAQVLAFVFRVAGRKRRTA